MDSRPGWLINAKKLWVEDDSGAYDREKIREAWERLFGEQAPPEDRSTALASYDGGDAFFYLYPHGRIYIISCTGEEIRLTEEAGKDLSSR